MTLKLSQKEQMAYSTIARLEAERDQLQRDLTARDEKLDQVREERDILQRRVDDFDRTVSGIPALARAERLRAALKFYADREHYHFESGNWDTVSGEPLNILWCGDEPDFIEDGSVARAALSASAEPSAQCATPGGMACPGDGVGECKRCPSAPVERDAETIRQQHYDEFMQRREARGALDRKA